MAEAVEIELPLIINARNFVFENIDDLTDGEIRRCDHRGYSILMCAAETGHIQVVNFLIERCEDLDFEVDGETATSLAFDNKHFGIVLSLLKANAKFPQNYNHEEASEELKAFVILSREMHEKVRNGNEQDHKKIQDTENFIRGNSERFPALRHFYDTNNNSLLKTAIVSKMFQIYKILITLNFLLGHDENVDDIMDELTYGEQRELRLINEELSTNIFTEPMMILMRNCKLGPGVTNHGQYIEFIRKAFDFLFKIPPIEIILKVVAARREFKIIFDFKRENVRFLDPSAEPYTNGIFYLNGKIYIGAKDMLDPQIMIKVYSVIAHELCHFAMFLVYENFAKPYRAHEVEIERDFERITEECQVVSETEEIVNLVFEAYPEEMFHAELIVRVPQMIVAYFNDLSLLVEKRQNFFRLFDFYEVNVVNEMERVLPSLEKKFHPERELKKKNKKYKLWIIFLALFITILIPLGAAGIFFVYKPDYSWSNLSDKHKNEFNNSTINFCGFDVKFGTLFASDSEIYSMLSSEQIELALNGNLMELTKVINSRYKDLIILNFSNMTESLRGNFVTQEVNFQGKNVSINKILKSYKILEKFTPSETLDTFCGYPIKISNPTEIKINFFIERFFVDDEMKLWDYSYIQLAKSEGNAIKFTENLLREIEYSNFFLLSSPAGEGKSSTLRHFAKNLKEKFPQNWIQFVDLKNHIEDYEKGEKLNFNNVEIISEFLTSNLLGLNLIERAIFKELLRLNRVVFLWDGIDEISPIYKNFMLKLTLAIKKHSYNWQIISTRPQFSEEFKAKFNRKAFKLLPMDHYEQTEFLVKFIASEKFQKIPEIFWKDVENYSYKHINIFLDGSYLPFESRKFYNENEKFFEMFSGTRKVLDLITKGNNENSLINPLLLRMVTEISIDENFNVNSTLSFFEIYQNFIDKKMEIVRNEKGKIVGKNIDKILGSSSVNVMQVHQAYAIKYIFGDYLKEWYNITLSNLTIMKSINKLSSVEISRFGILDLTSDYKLFFAHRTFAEFLVAQFLIDNFKSFNLNEPEGDSDLKILLLNLSFFNKRFAFCKKLIFDFARIQEKEETFYHILKDFGDFLRFFNRMLIEFSNFQNFTNFFNSSEIFKYVSDYMKFFFINFESKIKKEDISNILLSKNAYGSCLHEILENDKNSKFLNDFLSLFAKKLSRHQILELLFITRGDYNDLNENETSMMYAALYRNLNELIVFWNFVEEYLNEKEIKIFLLIEGSQKQTALQFSMLNKIPGSFLFVKEIYEIYLQDKILDILYKKSDTHFKFISYIVLNSSPETAREISNYLEKISTKSQIKRYLLPFFSHYDFSYKPEIYNIFLRLLGTTFDENIEFKFFVSMLENDAMLLKSMYFNVSYSEFKEIHRSRLWAEGDLKVISTEFHEAKTYIGENNLRNILISKYENDSAYTVLHDFVKVINKQDYTEKFLTNIESLLPKNDIIELVFSQEGEEFRTPLMISVWKNELEDLKIIWNFIDKNLNNEIKRRLLLVEDKNAWTSLQHSMTNRDEKSFLFTRAIYENYFTKKEIREILKKFNKKFLSFFDNLVKTASLQTSLEVSKFLKILFRDEKNELKTILTHKNEKGETIFNQDKNEKQNQEILKIFKELLNKI